MSTIYRVTALLLVAFWIASAALPPFLQPVQAAAPISKVRALTVAQDPVGRRWAAWEVDTGLDVDIYFSQWAGATWAMPQPVHRRDNAWDRSPSLVITGDGVVWLAWASAERAEPTRTQLYVSRWTGQSWSDPAAVPVGDVAKAREPMLAAGPDGALWLAWTGIKDANDAIYANRWEGAGWSRPGQVSAPDTGQLQYDCQPRLAVGANGQVWLAWTGGQDTADDEIYISHWTGTSWTPEQLVSQDDNSLDVWPSLALDEQGYPWLAWAGLADQTYPPRMRILTTHWDADAACWTSEAVASLVPELGWHESYPVLCSTGRHTMQMAWVASVSGSSALVSSQWSGAAWTEPSLVWAGVPDDRITTVTSGATTTAIWLVSHGNASETPTNQAVISHGVPLTAWAATAAVKKDVDPIPDYYLAFGDSITWGEYEDNPYPLLLDNRLDAEFRPSRVINAGKPGEDTDEGMKRIGDLVRAERPEYVLLMEGTNDVSHLEPPSHVQFYLGLTMDEVAWSGVRNVKVILATLVPRLDDLNDQTELTNEIAIAPLAAQRGVPLCDQWQAFHDYGPWQNIYKDDLHPNQTGLEILANTFFASIMADHDSTPPTATLDPLLTPSECADGVYVSWSGTDPGYGSGLASYDVQVEEDYAGVWQDWLVTTPLTNSIYGDVAYAHTFRFRVRARDRAGNVGEYSAPGATWIADTIPPYEAHVNPLPPAQVAPFAVGWWGRDACAGVGAYDVQYRAGASGIWETWLTATPYTTGSFTPTTPQYGATYYFRVRAQDVAGNWSAWSSDGEVYTRLARFTLSGRAFTIRHAPVALAEASLVPAALDVTYQPAGGYLAYVADAGNYDLTVNRAGFGPAKWMRDILVSAGMTDLDFWLAPLNSVVSDGDFEAGDWGTWQPGGSLTPTLSAGAHTGYGAALLGGSGGQSQLGQSIQVTNALTDATLSFLVRLDQDAGDSSVLHVELAGASVSHTLAVTTSTWTQAWYPVACSAGQALTLTFTLSDTPAILLDEVSLGTAAYGGAFAYLPLVARAGP